MVRQRLAVTGSFNSQIVGFRYFMFYGPRESHKVRMASVAFHHFQQFRSQGKVKLFEGCDGYADGEQRRHFVQVGDGRALTVFSSSAEVGIFNVGNGRAQPFNDLRGPASMPSAAPSGEAALSLAELVQQGLIEYIPFPADLQGNTSFHRSRPQQATQGGR